MQRSFIRLVLLGIFCAGVTSCSYFQKNNDDNKALCRQMKYDIIFNGATSNQHKAMRQRAEMATLQRSYREHGCK